MSVRKNAPLFSDGVAYLWAKIKSKFVAKEPGKTLTTNDYSDEDKAKLAGIDKKANRYVLPTATRESLGGVKIGAHLSIDENGVLNGRGPYHLPPASKDERGGVRIGRNLHIDGDVLSSENTTYGEATSSSSGLMSASDKQKLDSFQSYDQYVTKKEITRLYKVRASVETYSDLPLTGNNEGDARNVLEDGMNYVWIIDRLHPQGYWDPFATIIELDALTDREIDDICTY